MAKIGLYFDRRNEKAERYPVKVSVRHKGVAAYATTGIYLLPTQWDELAEKVISHPQRMEYNAHLQKMMLEAQEIVLSLTRERKISRMTAAQIKKQIECLTNPDNSTFIHIFEKFIEGKKKPKTKEAYQYTLSKLNMFCSRIKELMFEDITREWLMKFDNFVAETSPSQNSRNIHLRNIRAVFNYAIDEEITTAYPFRRMKIRPVETPKRSLTVEQLRQLFDYPVDDFQKKYVDIFKLIFFFIGINVVDLFGLKKIVNGRIEYRRAKTGRLYSIKVEPEALAIIERYRGEQHLIKQADTYKQHKCYMKRLNDNLKKIGTVERSGLGGKKHITPLFPDITTYWARHTWATIAASLDIPKETISAALGHEIGSRVTSIYINFDEKKIDEANRRVMDFVLYGKAGD